MTERIVNAERMEQLIDVFGSFDENIKKIEAAFQVHVVNRDTELKISGDEEQVDKGVRAVEGLLALAAKGESEISCVQYIERGYEDIVGKLRALGANIRVVEEPGENEELEAHIG